MSENAQPHGWMELMTGDVDGAKAFYQGVCGWGTTSMPMPGEVPGEYSMFTHGEQPFSGIFPLNMPGVPEGTPPMWMIYFNVDDVDAACEKAKGHGGTVVVEPFDIEGVGRTALLADPAGAHFYVFKSAQQ